MEVVMERYDVYSNFDIEKHKATFIDYLEVLILEDGKVVYAVPSHQMKAEELACERLKIDRNKLINLCPKEYYFDYLKWVLTQAGAVAVWNDFYSTGENGLNKRQKATLKKLKLRGLYKGILIKGRE